MSGTLVGGGIRLYQNGRVLPPFMDTRDPEAQRGTTRVRAVDPNLIVALDTRRHVYQVWGPSIDTMGWVPLFDVRDDRGAALRQFVDWDRIAFSILRGRDSAETALDRVEEHNRKLRERRERDAADLRLEKAKFCAGAIHEDGRISVDDMLLALKRAEGG